MKDEISMNLKRKELVKIYDLLFGYYNKLKKERKSSSKSKCRMIEKYMNILEENFLEEENF